MDNLQKVSARQKLSEINSKLVEARMWVTEGDELRAFRAAEEAYMAAFEAKDYLDKVLTGNKERQEV